MCVWKENGGVDWFRNLLCFLVGPKNEPAGAGYATRIAGPV